MAPGRFARLLGESGDTGRGRVRRWSVAAVCFCGGGGHGVLQAAPGGAIAAVIASVCVLADLHSLFGTVGSHACMIKGAVGVLINIVIIILAVVLALAKNSRALNSPGNSFFICILH